MKRKILYFVSFIIGLTISYLFLCNVRKENYYNVSNFIEIKAQEDSSKYYDNNNIYVSLPLMELYAFDGNKDSVMKRFPELKFGIDSFLQSWRERYSWIIMNSDTNNLKFLGKTKQLDTWVKQIDNYKLYDYYNVDHDSVYAKNIKEYNNWGVKK